MRADLVTADVARALAAPGCRDRLDGRRIGLAARPRRDGQGQRVEDIRGGAPAEGGRRRGRLLSAVRLSRRGLGRHRGDAGCSSARSGRTTSASRSRIRCRARSSTRGSGASSAPKQNWVDSADLAMMYRGTYSPDFYRQLHRLVHAEFRRVRLPPPGHAVRRPWLLRVTSMCATRHPRFEGAARSLIRRRLARMMGPAAADGLAAALVDASARRPTHGRHRDEPAAPSRALQPAGGVLHHAARARGSGLRARSLAIDVVIIDGRLEADPVAAVVAAARDAVCVGISVLTGAPIRDALAVSRAVKSAHPRCTVVWGGWHPSLFPRDRLADRAIDVVVQGQGEITFREIVERLLAGRTPAGCPGTTARIHGEVVAGVSRPLADLNTLPAHDYTLIPVARYFEKKRTRQIDYVSSQGCRFRCAFCAIRRSSDEPGAVSLRSEWPPRRRRWSAAMPCASWRSRTKRSSPRQRGSTRSRRRSSAAVSDYVDGHAARRPGLPAR